MTSGEFYGARKSMKLTQKQLGVLINMTQKSVSRIETGKRQPTKLHAATIGALRLLHEHGLLDVLYKRIKSGELF